MSFAKLKANSKKNFAELEKAFEDLNKKKTYDNDDSDYWNLSRDKSGVGSAIIRFLPAPEGEELPFVKIFSHGFKNEETGQWYIENSLSTLGKDDPVGKYNSELWNSSTEDKGPEREQARAQKRKLSYHSNIYVVKDPANPENEGKVFKFRYGAKIFGKIEDAMNPMEDELEDTKDPFNPFDLWEGANFRIRVANVKGFANYDKSDFAPCSALLDDDDKLEEIYNSAFSLEELIDEKNFKSYEELEARLHKVLGIDSPKTKSNRRKMEDEDTESPKETKVAESKKVQEVEDDEDDAFDFFNSIDDDDDIPF